MTDKAIKGLIFTAGALLGSAVSYIFLSKSYSDKINDLRKSYEEEFQNLSKKLYTNDIPNENVEAHSEDDIDPMKFKRDGNQSTDYTKMFQPSSVPNPVIGTPDYNDIVQAASYAGADDTVPYLVSQDIYDSNPRGYTKFELRYYIDDDYLCDVNELMEAILDIDRFIGYDNLKIFKETDEEYIYVQNDNDRYIAAVEVYRGCPCPINDIYDTE